MLGRQYSTFREGFEGGEDKVALHKGKAPKLQKARGENNRSGIGDLGFNDGNFLDAAIKTSTPGAACKTHFFQAVTTSCNFDEKIHRDILPAGLGPQKQAKWFKK